MREKADGPSISIRAYMALEHVVLATIKGYSHRVYLGGGIFCRI